MSEISWTSDLVLIKWPSRPHDLRLLSTLDMDARVDVSLFLQGIYHQISMGIAPQVTSPKQPCSMVTR